MYLFGHLLLIIIIIIQLFEINCLTDTYFKNHTAIFDVCYNDFLYIRINTDKTLTIFGTFNLTNYKNNLTNIEIQLNLTSPMKFQMGYDDGRVKIANNKKSFKIMYFNKLPNITEYKFRLDVIQFLGNFESILLNGEKVCNIIKVFHEVGGASSDDLQIINAQGCGRIPVLPESSSIGTASLSTIYEGKWPWHTAIYHRKNITTSVYLCGGTFVGSVYILTAAICIFDTNNNLLPTKNVFVQLGKFNIKYTSKKVQESEIFEIIPHPRYDPLTSENNIAILKLASYIQNTVYVQPACLWKFAQQNLNPFINKEGYTVGWGSTKYDNLYENLTQSELKIINPSICLASNRDFHGLFLSDKNFCAGNKIDISNTCNADLGSGFYVKTEFEFYHIRGILSIIVAETKNGKARCKQTEYAIFTDVAKYLSWIYKTTSYNN